MLCGWFGTVRYGSSLIRAKLGNQRAALEWYPCGLYKGVPPPPPPHPPEARRKSLFISDVFAGYFIRNQLKPFLKWQMKGFRC